MRDQSREPLLPLPGLFFRLLCLPPSHSGCSTESARWRTVSYRCDTPLSRAGSGSQPVPVGPGVQRAVTVARAAALRGSGGPARTCSGSLRPWLVAAAVRTLGGELARQRGAEGKGCVRRAVGVFGLREDFETGS